MSRRIVRIAVAGALLAGVTVVSFSGPAGAAGGELGALRIHGPGSAFAGSQAIVSSSVTAGGTATFAVQIKNTGPDTAQYNVFVESVGAECGPTVCPVPTTSFAAGSLIATKLAVGPNGYFTPPIDPAKLGAFTFKVTTPKTAPPGSNFVYAIVLDDTAQNLLDNVEALVFTTRSHGTSGADQFVSASGTPATGTDPDIGDIAVTAPTVAVGGSAAFTVKLQNNSTVPGPIQYTMDPPGICPSFFGLKVTVGSLDVTQRVLDGSYQTASLAHGASVSLKVTVSYQTSAGFCLKSFGAGYTYVDGAARDAHGDVVSENMVVDVAAFN